MFSPLAFFCSSVVLISFLLGLRRGFVSWAWLVLPLGSDVFFLEGLFVRTEVFVMANETVVICLLLSWRDSFNKLSV